MLLKTVNLDPELSKCLEDLSAVIIGGYALEQATGMEWEDGDIDILAPTAKKLLYTNHNTGSTYMVNK